jgi:hypothetical protein
VDSTVIILIVVIVVLLLALGAAAVVISRRRRSEQLQEHYGPEYERSVRETGDRRSAEAALTEREQRVKDLDIRELRPEERAQYRASWNDIQRGFVDDPVRSVHAADRLVVDVMKTRGYPVDDFDRRAEDISVAHPEVVEHYRDARAVREATDQGNVDTDQQRRAVTSYRDLVDALIGAETEDRDRDRDRDRDEHADHDHADGRRHVEAAPRGHTDDRAETDARYAEDPAAAAGHYADDRQTTEGRYVDDRPTNRPQTEEHTR